MKQFTSYLLTTNIEVSLSTVLMMCELLIYNIIKENEAQAMKLFISYQLATNTEVKEIQCQI